MIFVATGTSQLLPDRAKKNPESLPTANYREDVLEIPFNNSEKRQQEIQRKIQEIQKIYHLERRFFF